MTPDCARRGRVSFTHTCPPTFQDSMTSLRIFPRVHAMQEDSLWMKWNEDSQAFCFWMKLQYYRHLGNAAWHFYACMTFFLPPDKSSCRASRGHIGCPLYAPMKSPGSKQLIYACKERGSHHLGVSAGVLTALPVVHSSNRSVVIGVKNLSCSFSYLT